MNTHILSYSLHIIHSEIINIDSYHIAKNIHNTIHTPYITAHTQSYQYNFEMKESESPASLLRLVIGIVVGCTTLSGSLLMMITTIGNRMAIAVVLIHSHSIATGMTMIMNAGLRWLRGIQRSRRRRRGGRKRVARSMRVPIS